MTKLKREDRDEKVACEQTISCTSVKYEIPSAAGRQTDTLKALQAMRKVRILSINKTSLKFSADKVTSTLAHVFI